MTNMTVDGDFILIWLMNPYALAIYNRNRSDVMVGRGVKIESEV